MAEPQTMYVRNESNHTIYVRVEKEGNRQSDEWFEIPPRGTEFWKRTTPRVHINTQPRAFGEHVMRVRPAKTYIYTGWQEPYLLSDAEWREQKEQEEVRQRETVAALRAELERVLLEKQAAQAPWHAMGVPAPGVPALVPRGPGHYSMVWPQDNGKLVGKGMLTQQLLVADAGAEKEGYEPWVADGRLVLPGQNPDLVLNRRPWLKRVLGWWCCGRD